MTAVVISGLVVACSSESPEGSNTKTLELSHVQTATDFAFFHVFATEFQSNVREYSRGELDVQIIPAGQLGGERVMAEGLQLGTTDSAIISSFQLGNFTAPLLTFDLPFLLPDYDVANQILRSESAMEPFNQALREVGMVPLAWGNGGFRSMISNTPGVETAEDLRDIKIRLPESRVYMEAFKELGANPLPMAFGEVVPALQQGTIDATENSLQGIYEQRWFEVASEISLTEHFFSPIPMLIDERIWAGFSPEEQKILRKAAIDAANYEHEFLTETHDEAKALLREEGVSFSQPNTDELRKDTYPLYRSFLEGENGEYLEHVLRETNQAHLIEDIYRA
ncbi:MAG TPA: TRAP transporter substrate-binding protein [Candidatus Corynebacterium gallistercoris]|uniref:TRAP transporter substrate-binding protein n=1 Tax=Candidatus Corynebacterium gallistercoris TaxID=2838530 RepID=A0A9D1S079_9CORY|nr:TRAP transporter substrate-binding protein [Candidatus Corynebacterium gallistercoris]